MSGVSKSVAIVTGASRGIGASTARLLSRQARALILVSRESPALRALEKELATSCEVLVLPMDLERLSNPKPEFDLIQKRFGRADILVNNAGTISVKKVEDVQDKDWSQSLQVNLRAPFLLAREFFVRNWLDSSILNISSIAGVQGLEKFEGFSSYTAAKSALVGLTEVMAVEGRSRNIRVNVLCPGAVDTQMLQEALPGFKTDRKPEHIAEIIHSILQKSFQENASGMIEVLSND